ncbi:MAG: M16 family metallopeptidase [Alphaproteobacteria bacterium]
MKKWFLLLVVVLCSTFIVYFVSSNKSQDKNLSTMSRVKLSFEIKEIPTEFGADLWFTKTEGPLISIVICFRNVGASAEKEKKGLSDLLASCLYEGGAGPYDSQALRRVLLENGINLSINAGYDSFIISIQIVKENVEKALAIIKYILTEPKFEKEVVDRIKAQTIASLQQALHYPQILAKEILEKYLLGEEHPYYADTKKCLKTIPVLTTNDFSSFIKSHFTKENLLIVAAGNADENELLKQLNIFAKSLPKGDKKGSSTKYKLMNLGKTINHFVDVPQTFISFVHPSINFLDDDFYALLVAVHIFGSGEFDSRLWDSVREKGGYAYFCSVSLFNQDLCDLLIGKTGTHFEKTNDLIKLIRAEFDRFIDKGITKEELDRHKRILIGSYPLKFSSTTGMVGAILGARVRNIPIERIFKRNEIIEKLTVEDINRVIKKVLKADQLMFVTLGKNTNKR